MRSSLRTWMLPEGVVEALPRDAKKLNELEQVALSTFSRWGYLPLRPPMLEYAKTFIGGEFSDNLSAQTIQFKDQKSGKQLGFRADITPQVARIDAHYLKTKNVARYTYAGEVVRSFPEGHGSARNPTVVGAELLGSSSKQADIEIVSLLIEYLQNIQLKKFLIELGNVDIAVELLSFLQVPESEHQLFFEALATKDTERLSILVQRNKLSSDKELIMLTQLHGGLGIIEEAKLYFSSMPTVLRQINHLQSIAQELQASYPDTEFHVDFADVHGYGYHNGLIFSAYVKAAWQPVARGGRYDSFGQHLAADNRPSTGFSCDLNLLTGLVDDVTSPHRNIQCKYNLSSNTVENSLVTYIRQLRNDGDTVICVFDDDVDCDINCQYEIAECDGFFSVTEITKR